MRSDGSSARPAASGPRTFPWARPTARHTRDFEDMVLWLVTRTDRTSVSTLMRCAWRTVTSIVTRAVDALIDSRRLENLYRIGVDEICYRHPHKYLTIVGDHDTGKVVYITEGRGRDSFSEFFEQQSAKERDKVQVVSMDGSPAFRAAAEDHVPRARQCMDPFHVVDAAHARDIAADADVEPVRVPNSETPTTYRPGTVLDTWMRVLAGGCEWLHCDVAAWNTDLDHHRPFDHSDPAAGGPTAAGNLTAYCRNHHRLKHSGHWQVNADGGIELVAPTGHRYRPRSAGILGARGRDRIVDPATRRRTRAQNDAARIRAERRRRHATDEPAPF
nr:transposase [Rhodococcus koreensis]